MRVIGISRYYSKMLLFTVGMCCGVFSLIVVFSNMYNNFLFVSIVSSKSFLLLTYFVLACYLYSLRYSAFSAICRIFSELR